MRKDITDQIKLLEKNFISLRMLTCKHDTHKVLISMLYASENKIVDTKKLQKCRDMVDNEPTLKIFSGMSMLTLAGYAAMEEEPEKFLADVLNVYETLKARGYSVGEYTVITAMYIVRGTIITERESIIDRAKSFLGELKEGNRLSSGRDDYIYTAMFAMSELDPSEGITRMERYYKEMKSTYNPQNDITSLSTILALIRVDSEMKQRMDTLTDELKDFYGLDYKRAYALPTIGVMAIASDDLKGIAAETYEAYEAIRKSRVLTGKIAIGERMVLAACFAGLSAVREEEARERATIVTTTEHLKQAQVMCFIICMCGMAGMVNA